MRLKKGELPEFIDLSRAVCVDVIRPHLAAELSEELADQIVYGILQLYGGTLVAVPKTDIIDRDARNRSIWQQFNEELGESEGPTEVVNRIARRWNLTAIHIYRILAKERERRRHHHGGRPVTPAAPHARGAAAVTGPESRRD